MRAGTLPTLAARAADLPGAGRLHNMSAPPRTAVPVEVRPLPEGYLLFEAALRLEAVPPGLHQHTVFELGLAGVPSQAAVEAAAGRLPGFLVGLPVKPPLLDLAQRVQDEALVYALLARRADAMFLGARQPDYTAARLLGGGPFVTLDFLRGATHGP